MKEAARLVRLTQITGGKKSSFLPVFEARLYCKGGTDDAHFEKLL